MKFNTLGIIVKTDTESVEETLLRLLNYLEAGSCEILLDKSVGNLDVKTHQVVDRQTLSKESDLAIVVGGDGTMLNAARSLTDDGVPLIGVNIGKLGFLADIAPTELETSLDEILQGNFESENRFLLQASVVRGENIVYFTDALNDVVVHIRDVARMIEYKTRINGQLVNHQRADGIIISSPTGSTAYALSCGGPIIQTGLEAMTLVPISPHTLSNRPVVIRSDSEVDIEVCETRKSVAQITTDGQSSFDVQPGDHIRVIKKEHPIKLLHPPGHNYFEILRTKLHWNEFIQQ